MMSILLTYRIINFSIEDVFKRLSFIKGNWSVGSDGIPGEFLYRIQSIIAYPLLTGDL